MAKTKTYIEMIRKQVKADNNGKVPEHLELTIRNYASALETRDMYRDAIKDNPLGPIIKEQGSNFQTTTKQHPLCGLLYQQEMLCLSYAKALGATSAKAAAKTERPDNVDDNDPMRQYYQPKK